MTAILPFSDLELLDCTRRGDREAYGQLVSRHQAAVCAISYSVLGDVARSEDVAQEAFLTAWRQLSQLNDAAKFKPWVCGIARKLALALLRRERKCQPLESADLAAAAQPTPEEWAVTREEQAVVWKALESLPETYREPLVLFYREELSVARVADALELSIDAVKQRLSRGREILREEIAAKVEKALRKSGPGTVFTLAVLGALPGIGAATASAATVGATSKLAPPMAAATMKAGMAAGLLGTLGGLFGPMLGAWVSWQTSRYQRERDLIRRAMISYAVGFVIFCLPFAIIALGIWRPNPRTLPAYLVFYAVWMSSFFAANFLWMWNVYRKWRTIVSQETASGAAALPQSPLQRWLACWEGRQWQSQWKCLGLPLVHVNFGDPESASTALLLGKRHVAHGWIALGDTAYGVILAVGNKAVGGVAIGGLSVGVIAIGGVGFGIIGIGGVGVGLVAIGGVAAGLAAVGGFAVGWLALGGAAVGWKAAKGGFALAHDFAVGGSSIASHANDVQAAAFIANSQFFRSLEPILALVHRETFWFSIGATALIPTSILAFWFVAYRRKTTSQNYGDRPKAG